jgi:hypothetical protein
MNYRLNNNNNATLISFKIDALYLKQICMIYAVGVDRLLLLLLLLL